MYTVCPYARYTPALTGVGTYGVHYHTVPIALNHVRAVPAAKLSHQHAQLRRAKKTRV